MRGLSLAQTSAVRRADMGRARWQSSVTWKRAKKTPSALMWRPPSGNPRNPGCVISATPAKHSTMAMPTALQKRSQMLSSQQSNPHLSPRIDLTADR